MQTSKDHFSSRWTLLLSALGVAVGTGNIWRFPRVAALNGSEHGAGALIIAWIILLFLWSIPLIIAEYFIGKKYRLGLVGNMVKISGKKSGWKGGFVALVATGISFFYAVIVGWSLFYLYWFIAHPLPQTNQASQLIWHNFQAGITPGFFHLTALLIGAFAISKGVKSIERVNSFLIPSLIVIVLIAFFRTLFLPGALNGIRYLFTPDIDQLADPRIWLEALTQNAWDTGAGWGLFLTYAVYAKSEYGTVKNAFITGIGNNLISLIMAMVIFGTVFSVFHFMPQFSGSDALEVMKTSGPASTGLTFIWIPQLFSTIPFGRILAILFFAGLSFAGFSSLISMLEMTTKVVMDSGISRRKSVLFVFCLVYVCGIPSVFNIHFLSNQDFVWGLGLIVSGLIISFSVKKIPYTEIHHEQSLIRNDWNVNRLWAIAIKFFIPVAGIILIIWWLLQSVLVFDPDSWFNPFSEFSVSTVLVQWGIGVVLVLLLNRFLTRKIE